MPEQNELKSAAVPAQNGIDIAQIKTMVDLPETASDVELITVLVNLIANLQEKYEGVLQDAVSMEDSLTNRELMDFADVIDEANAPFWKEQILRNRKGALDWTSSGDRPRFSTTGSTISRFRTTPRSARSRRQWRSDRAKLDSITRIEIK